MRIQNPIQRRCADSQRRNSAQQANDQSQPTEELRANSQEGDRPSRLLTAISHSPSANILWGQGFGPAAELPLGAEPVPAVNPTLLPASSSARNPAVDSARL